MTSFARLLPSLAVIAALTGCSEAVDPADVEANRPAKNVILFLGDGMGMSTVTAARIFDGQSRGGSGEENVLPFEEFPNTAFIKTYNTNQQVPDSAGTATAIHTGVKTRAGMINVGPDARRRDCDAARTERLTPMGELVRIKGKALGIVTTTRITHATPATVYASSPERDYESDEFMEPEVEAAGCVDIARQLLKFATDYDLHIALGGGLREFRGTALGGKRRDRYADLITDWADASNDHVFVDKAVALGSLDPSKQVIGLFSSSHLDYIANREPGTTQPTLPQMTAAAIDHLEAQDQGYYLLVEGGRIDHGHHDGYPGWAMLEAQAFAQSVQVALDKVNLDDTMIIVTADHSHVMTIAGYPTRGNPILGHVVPNDVNGEPKDGPKLAADGQPYTTLGYVNGPFAVGDGPRPEPETGINAKAQALYRLDWDDLDGSVYPSESHGGEDVPLYAIGNGSGCFYGTMEQNRIFNVIEAAFGWEKPVCQRPDGP